MPQSSHLFTIRVWQEEIGTEQNEWRGRVQLLTSGEVRYFRDWHALVSLLLTMLAETQSGSGHDESVPTGEF